MRHLIFIIIFTLTNLTNVNAQQPVEKELTKEEVRQYLMLLAFSAPLMGTYRMTQIECSDLYPENAEKYESYFKEGNYERIESSLKTFMPDPKATLDARKKENFFSVERQAISQEHCLEMLNGVTQIAKSLEPNNAQKINVDDFILFVEKITGFDDKELTEYLGSFKK